MKSFVDERHNEMFEEMQADGIVQEGTELTAADLPVVSLEDYLENVSLLSAVDLEDDEETSNKIALMTVHSSKGLEFPYVYVAGMEENIFPSGGFMASENEIEEERRLFYVAMTRAKKALSFSFAATRLRNGKHESNSPSRFVREVDARYVANPLGAEVEHERESGRMQSFGSWGGRNTYGRSGSVRTEAPVRQQSASRPVISSRPQNVIASRAMPSVRPQPVPKRVADADFEPTPILKLKAGQRIEHNRFGLGVIREITGNPADLKAKIAFDEHGEKTLILKYAKIRALDID